MKTHVDRQVKERPILYNGPMVRAVLEDIKLMTRRQNGLDRLNEGYHKNRIAKVECRDGIWCFWEIGHGSSALPVWTSKCPYGVPDDRLWVRETWAHVPLVEDDGGQGGKMGAIYKADGEHAFDEMPEEWDFLGKWKPSIHMPRWASRITLEITGVRVERVQDITAKEIIAEGAVLRPHVDKYLGKMPVSAFDGKAYPDLRSLWGHGWNGIYKNWQKNPWVWVIEFKRL